MRVEKEPAEDPRTSWSRANLSNPKMAAERKRRGMDETGVERPAEGSKHPVT